MLCVSSFFLLLLLIEKIMFISSASAGCVWKTKWKIEPELETFANCEARQNFRKIDIRYVNLTVNESFW